MFKRTQIVLTDPNVQADEVRVLHLKGDIQKLEKEASTLGELIADLVAQKQELADDQESMRLGFENDINWLTDEKTNLEIAIAELLKKFDWLGVQIVGRESDRDELEAKMGQLQSAYTTLETAYEGMKVAHNALKQTIEAQEVCKISLDAEHEAKKANYAAIEQAITTRITEKRQEEARLDAKVTGLSGESVRLTAENKKAEETVAAIVAAAEERARQIEEKATKAANEAQTKVITLTAEANTLQAQIEANKEAEQLKAKEHYDKEKKLERREKDLEERKHNAAIEMAKQYQHRQMTIEKAELDKILNV